MDITNDLHKTILFFILAMFALFLSANAQESTIKIWKDNIPGAIDNSSYKCDTIYFDNNSPRIIKVTDPALDVFPAPKNKANGTAIVICPGGGYERIAIKKEGHTIAQWLNKFGVTAFVLKYRLPSDSIMQDKSIGPLQDGLEAIRIIRRDCKKWSINPNKIGIMGFSAGGHLASSVSTHFNDTVYEPIDTTSARPDFTILAYPVISMDTAISHPGSRKMLIGDNYSPYLVNYFSNDLWVNKNTPPAFIVHASDDNAVPVENSINYFIALKKNNIPVEFHSYEKGGHGFGLEYTKGTISTWPAACINWLKNRGFL